MRKGLSLVFIVILTVILSPLTLTASANDSKDLLIVPDLISFSNGIGSVYETGQESNAGFKTYSYQCQTNQVESVVQEYIRELRKHGIYISQSKKTVYDSTTNDANFGVALQDKNSNRAKYAYKDSLHGWSFKDVSIYISFSTGGDYDSQYIEISYAKDCYNIADTQARMRMDRSFSPADYYFYRKQLKTDAQKSAYDYILKKVESMETTISLEGLSTRMDYDEFFLVWYSVLVDNPQIFTTDDTYIGDISYFNDGTVRSFRVSYYKDKNDLPALEKRYEQAIAEALKVIDPYMTDYQKERALHDWLCNHVSYDYNISVGTTCSYGAIVDGQAVCEGYSEAFTELLHRAGIDAATVYGFALPEENFSNNSHAWNIVCISGDWYYVDVTWDDDTYPIRYDYFNMSTEQMALDHVNGIGTFPLCGSTAKPSATQLSNVKWDKTKKAAKISWRKNNTGNGYEVQCSTDKKFKNSVKRIKIDNNKTVKTTIKSLKKGTWYFRIRTVNGTLSSGWSKVKKLKVSK